MERRLVYNYAEGLSGTPKILKSSGEVKGIQVKGIDAHHDESGGSERGNNTLFTFTVDDIKICFMGDLGHMLSAEQVEAVGPLDLLLLPVGGTFTVDAEVAAELAEALSPKLVIPMHYKTDKCELPLAEVDSFLIKMKNVKHLAASEFELTPAILPAAGSEVWVMDHAC